MTGRAALLLLAFSLAPRGAAAQLHVEAGASVTGEVTRSSALGNAASVGPLLRLAARPGWGPAGAFNWYSMTSPAGQLSVKPLMGGYGYTFAPGSSFVNLSIVAGPAYNSLDTPDGTRHAWTFPIRPGISVTAPIVSRLSFTAFGGYILNRPHFDSGTPSRGWPTDALVLSAGAVYRIF
jgi:hypothetical protein